VNQTGVRFLTEGEVSMRIVGLLLVLFVGIGCVSMAQGGQDATNCWLTIRPVSVNGTNGAEVVAYYPASWSSRVNLTCSNLLSAGWAGINLSDQLETPKRSPTGERPKWTRWVMKLNRQTAFYRIKKG